MFNVQPHKLAFFLSCARTRRQTLFAKSRTLGNSYGLDAEHIKQLFGDGHPGSHAEFILELMDQNKLGRIDFFEVRSPDYLFVSNMA